jgi:hypothetical protein
VVPLTLDITDRTSIAQAAEAAPEGAPTAVGPDGRSEAMMFALPRRRSPPGGHFHDSVMGIDLRGADDFFWSAAGGADVRGVEVRLDHGPRGARRSRPPAGGRELNAGEPAFLHDYRGYGGPG